MASFIGDECVEEAAAFESAFFGDEEFMLSVTPIGSVSRRVSQSDPMMGFDPTTLQPSEGRPPVLQPPIMTSTDQKIPLTCGRSRLHGPDPKYDILKESYKRLLVREDSAIEEPPEDAKDVWSRLGRSSSPIGADLVCADVCGMICNGSCRPRQERFEGLNVNEVRNAS